MTLVTKFARDIRELLASIKIDTESLQKFKLAPKDREVVRKHLKLCQSQIRALTLKLGGI